ncbi:MAG: stage II sporulation protein R [Eubacteriales bacterium]
MKLFYNKFLLAEISLLAGVIIAFSSVYWLSDGQEQLADGLIRLHVVANSDTTFDQDLKLVVRDQVLLAAEELYPEGASYDEISTILTTQLPHLQEVGQSVAGEYPVTAELVELWFPTKVYENFSLPAGIYTALQVTIGEGEGENWWCVAYPPLCVGAASMTLEQAVEAGSFTNAELDLITGEGYVLKFKSIELLEEVKHFFSK